VQTERNLDCARRSVKVGEFRDSFASLVDDPRRAVAVCVEVGVFFQEQAGALERLLGFVIESPGNRGIEAYLAFL
jgi:hypothetical protein